MKQVESLIDRSEPRNLILGFADPLKKKDLEEMLLFFDTANKCTYVKNMLDLSKQT